MEAPAYLSGQLLLAMPGIGDPRFARAVIAMCAHDENGALGIGVGDTITVAVLGVELTARIASHDADGLTRLETGAGPLWLPAISGPVGREVRIRIAAQDVILSRTRPAGLSALNILPGVVLAVRPGDGPGLLVQLDVGGQRLLARITRRSALALDVSPGQLLHLIVKSVAVAQGDVGVAAAG